MKSKRVLIVLMFIFLSILLVSCSAGPDKVVQNFFRALDKGEIEESMGYLSVTTLQSLGTDKWRLALSEIANEMASEGGLKSVRVLDKNVNGDIAYVTVSIAMKNGTEDTDSMELIKESGGWKIYLDPWSK